MRSPRSIFLTGSTGFIGSHFLRIALTAGYDVYALRSASSQPSIPITECANLTWVEGRLQNFFSPIDPHWLAISQRYQTLDLSTSTLVHLAAAGVNPKNSTWDLCFEVNVLQSVQLWRRAIAAGVRRFIICGSCFEYGLSAEQQEFISVTAPLLPTGPYHASKAAATMAAIALCIEKKVQMAILRPFHVFGEGESPERFWPSLRRAALAGEDFPMSPGDQVRDFIHVEEVAQTFLRTVERMSIAPASETGSRSVSQTLPKPLIANVGSGHAQTLRAFAETWWERWNAKGKLLPGTLPYRPNEVMRYVPTIDPHSFLSSSGSNGSMP